MNRRLALARWSLGTLYGEELPDIACELLMAGFDNQWLREVAGMASPTLRDALDTFDRALRGAGFAPHPRQVACGMLAWETARAIVAGEIHAYSGAQTLAALASDCEDYPELFVFYDFTDAYYHNLGGRPDLDAEIVAEAQKFVEAHPDLAA